MQNNRDEIEPWKNRVPPGVPGAGWLVMAFYVFAVVVLSSWWYDVDHSTGSTTAAASASSHHANARMPQ